MEKRPVTRGVMDSRDGSRYGLPQKCDDLARRRRQKLEQPHVKMPRYQVMRSCELCRLEILPVIVGKDTAPQKLIAEVISERCSCGFGDVKIYDLHQAGGRQSAAPVYVFDPGFLPAIPVSFKPLHRFAESAAPVHRLETHPFDR